jgi:hypothetical protein
MIFNAKHPELGGKTWCHDDPTPEEILRMCGEMRREALRRFRDSKNQHNAKPGPAQEYRVLKQKWGRKGMGNG